MWYVHPYQSCQPLHFGHSFLHPRALHYAATIMIVSLRSPSEILFILDPLHACGHQMRQQPVACAFFVSEMLVVPQPISIRVLTSWPVVAFSSPLLCVTSWQDNFRFQSFQMAVPKQAPGWWVLSKKTAHQSFLEDCYTEKFMCIVHSTQSAKREEQCLLLQFLGLFCHPWRNVRCQTTRQLETSHQQRTSYFKLCIMPMELLSGTSFACNYGV